MGKLPDLSATYNKQIADLTEWFRLELAKLPALSVTGPQYRRGTDALSGDYAALVKRAFDAWGEQRDYELSYQQINVAFWDAWQK